MKVVRFSKLSGTTHDPIVANCRIDWDQFWPGRQISW